MLKKEMKVCLKFRFDKLYRNYEVLLQILKEDDTESKIIRLIIDVAPKRIVFRGEI